MTEGSRDVAGAGTAGASTAVGIAAASCGLVLAALPIFLVGGLAVQIRAELGFSEAALGAAVAGAFVAGGCAAPLGGRLADRVGPRAAVLAGSTLTVLALTGLAAWAHTWGHVALMLALSWLAAAITDPGLAILLSRAVPVARQGLAFGVKEASIPLASLAAGLAVPAIALTVGWRWAFTLGALPLAGLLVLLPRLDLPARPRPARDGDAGAAPVRAAVPSGRALLLVTVAAGLGVGAASGVGVFLTQSAVAMGVSPSSAGLLLAAGSLAGIVTRVSTGIVADRDPGEQFGLISWMLAAGAVAMALGATGAAPLLVAGTIGVFAAGWGWTGLLFLSLVRASPAAPGRAAGIGIAGLAAGNGLGPLLFGVVAQAVSFGAAWAGAAAMGALAALLMRLARSRFRPSGGSPAAA